MRKLARIVMGVFEARHNHVGAKRCYGYKISKGEFIKVTIGIAEQQESVIWQCAFPMGERGGGGGFPMWFKGVQGAFRVIPTQLRSQRYNALEETNEIR
jgi:hypothetical protein